MPSREEIVEEARKWLGTRWRHQGRNASGLDCIGLLVRVATDLGISDYDIKGYSRRTVGDDFTRHFEIVGLKRKPIPDAEPGDILITHDRNFPCHCGIVAKKNGQMTFIHAYAGRKKVVEDPLSAWTPCAVTALEF